LASFNHEDHCFQKLSKQQEAVASIGPRTAMISKKEDLAQVDLFSSPADLNSRKVKFAFKVFEGGNETPGEVIHWICNVEQAFTGLNGHTGTLQQQMVQQLAQGSALSAFNNLCPD